MRKPQAIQPEEEKVAKLYTAIFRATTYTIIGKSNEAHTVLEADT